MKTTLVRGFATACFVLLPFLNSPSAQAVELLSPNDYIIAIDLDPPVADSSYPDGELPLNALDDDTGTKYLNFGKLDTGFIATPDFPTTVQSVRFSTANDAEARDPASWELFGTNDTITSTDNSLGDGENWSLITSSSLSLPSERLNNTTILNFANSTQYSSYRVIFPTVKDAESANSMQIADIQLYSDIDAGGSSAFALSNLVLAIGLNSSPDSDFPAGEAPRFLLDGTGPLPGATSGSHYPEAEGPSNIVDGTLAKYLNGAGLESGFIVTPASGSSIVRSFQLTTANDAEERDPYSYELWGTNESILSTDNSFGLAEDWTMVSSGALTLPTERDSLGGVVATGNSTTYSSYKMIFPELQGPSLTAMQIAEAAFYTTTNGTGANVLAPGDMVLAIDQTIPTGKETKYLNFGQENSGFIIAPFVDSTINEFQVTTADDHAERDPESWAIYGTNEILTSEENGQGDGENWTLIDSGSFTEAQMPTDRLTTGTAVSVSNITEYASYRMVFTSLWDLPEDANSMQLAGIQFFGDITSSPDANIENDGDVDGADFLAIQRMDPSLITTWESTFGSASALAASSAVPEPAAGALLLFGLLATSAMGRGRASLGATS
jgi:hypothetical protein